MKRITLLAALLSASFLTTAAPGHESPGFQHSHAFRQTGYGTYRQGHVVDGPQGSIIIWSPANVSGYSGESRIRFARPQPISRPPGSPPVPREAGQGQGNQFRNKPKYGHGD